MKNNPKFGEIYLVRFHPSFGGELKRFRPAVIMSEKINHIDKRFTLIAPLTTQVSKINEDCEFLIKKGENGLSTDSVILSWYLKTVDVVRLESYVGKLSDKDKIALKKIVTGLFS